MREPTPDEVQAIRDMHERAVSVALDTWLVYIGNSHPITLKAPDEHSAREKVRALYPHSRGQRVLVSEWRRGAVAR